MANYPKLVRSGADAVFNYRADLYTVRQPAASDTTDAVTVIPHGAREEFVVYKGTPPASRAAADVGPVYSAGPDGPLAIPTGRIFVRLSDGVRPDHLRKQFEAAGFRIAQTLSYAPNAAWLEPLAEAVHRTLPDVNSLEQLTDVVLIEPQLLFERGERR